MREYTHHELWLTLEATANRSSPKCVTNIQPFMTILFTFSRYRQLGYVREFWVFGSASDSRRKQSSRWLMGNCARMHRNRHDLVAMNLRLVDSHFELHALQVTRAAEWKNISILSRRSARSSALDPVPCLYVTSACKSLTVFGNNCFSDLEGGLPWRYCRAYHLTAIVSAIAGKIRYRRCAAWTLLTG